MARTSDWRRRDFLRAAMSGGVAAPALGWATQTPRLAPNECLKLAFVGVGGKGC